MDGIFGDLFDLDGDGSLDSMELAGDYALADELMNEEEEEERAQENAEAQGQSGERHAAQERGSACVSGAAEGNGTNGQYASQAARADSEPIIHRYCRVKFSDGESCWYIADDQDVESGDSVRVLYGPKGEFCTGQVTAVYETREENGPAPIEKMRHIINLVNPTKRSHRKHTGAQSRHKNCAAVQSGHKTYAAVQNGHRDAAEKQGPSLGRALKWTLLYACVHAIFSPSKSSGKSRKRR